MRVCLCVCVCVSVRRVCACVCLCVCFYCITDPREIAHNFLWVLLHEQRADVLLAEISGLDHDSLGSQPVCVRLAHQS